MEDESDFAGNVYMFDESVDISLVNMLMKDSHYVNSGQAGFYLFYAMINGGIVVLPFAAYHAGIPLFIACVAFVSFISGYINYMLIQMARRRDNDNILHQSKYDTSLEVLSEKAFGVKGYYAMSLLQMIFSFTLMCITLDIWGDIVPDLVRPHKESFPPALQPFVTRQYLIVVGAVLMLPLCCLRSMPSLSFNSFLTVFSIFCALLSVVIATVTAQTEGTDIEHMIRPRSLFWTVQLVVTFCFSYHQKIFSVFNCLKSSSRNSASWRTIVIRVHVLISLLYILFGTMGSLSIKSEDHMKYNYFKNYNATGSKLIFDIARGIFACCILCTFPVDCLVAVNALRRMRRKYASEKKRRCNSDDCDDETTESLLSSARNTDEDVQQNVENSWERHAAFQKVPTGCSATDSESVPPASVEFFDPTPPPQTPPQPRKSILRTPQKTPSKSTRVSFANETSLKDSPEEPRTEPQGAMVPMSGSSIRTRTSYMYSDLSSAAPEQSDADLSERASSVGQLRERLSHASYATQCWENMPVLFAWVGAVLVCVNQEHWVYWAASLGALLTSVLVFILPTMLYFRIGALCDFQSIPILGILPNKAAMFCIQIMGILFTVGNIVYMFYITYQDPDVMKNF